MIWGVLQFFQLELHFDQIRKGEDDSVAVDQHLADLSSPCCSPHRLQAYWTGTGYRNQLHHVVGYKRPRMLKS